MTDAFFDLRSETSPDQMYGAIQGRVNWFLRENEGRFYLNDLYEYCEAHGDNRIKSAIRQAVSRLKKEGTIEACGDRAGCYRKTEQDFKVVDLAALDEEPPMEVRLPLGADRFVEIFPKDLIVFAGTPNAGKSALMLETVRLNMERHECFYFSTEMGARNCRMRIGKHPHTPVKDWRFKFIEEFGSYRDVIQPDAINFIDYIEVADGEAFKVPSILGGIQRKLHNGIAFVALQKNPGHPHAIGGHQTLAKPALFMALENSALQILKAKNWRSEINPNGYGARFKIYQGIEISRVGEWVAP